MYKPDPTFMKKLKRLDKKLGCEYKRDSGREGKFVITYDRPYKAPAVVAAVETDDGGFRFPHEKDIELLHNGDTHNPRVRREIKETALWYERQREKQDKFNADERRHAIADSRRQLMPAFQRLGNTGGKNNSTFRRINLKPKGKVF
jgi:hypothetical protein